MTVNSLLCFDKLTTLMSAQSGYTVVLTYNPAGYGTLQTIAQQRTRVSCCWWHCIWALSLKT